MASMYLGGWRGSGVNVPRRVGKGGGMGSTGETSHTRRCPPTPPSRAPFDHDDAVPLPRRRARHRESVQDLSLTEDGRLLCVNVLWRLSLPGPLPLNPLLPRLSAPAIDAPGSESDHMPPGVEDGYHQPTAEAIKHRPIRRATQCQPCVNNLLRRESSGQQTARQVVRRRGWREAQAEEGGSGRTDAAAAKHVGARLRRTLAQRSLVVIGRSLHHRKLPRASLRGEGHRTRGRRPPLGRPGRGGLPGVPLDLVARGEGCQRLAERQSLFEHHVVQHIATLVAPKAAELAQRVVDGERGRALVAVAVEGAARVHRLPAPFHLHPRFRDDVREHHRMSHGLEQIETAAVSAVGRPGALRAAARSCLATPMRATARRTAAAKGKPGMRPGTVGHPTRPSQQWACRPRPDDVANAKPGRRVPGRTGCGDAAR
eukprot:scaffold2454_cov90-Isochrysis_galbana.AAC.2